MDENNEQEFKVVDKRRYTADGELKEPEKETSQTEAESSKDQKISASAVTAGDAAKAASGGEAPEVDFSSFVVSLATQALIMLGEMPTPNSKAPQVNLEAARQTIDILAILEEKTAGNLTDDEKKLLGDVLASLRIAYVNTAQTK